MSIATVLILFLLIIAIYLILISLFTLLYRITGLTRNVAFFQTISLLTAVGFTTSESEVIVEHPIRRRLAIIEMIIGSILSITLMSLLIDTFAKFDGEAVKDSLDIILFALGIFIFLVIFFSLPFIRKPIENTFTRLVYKMMRRKNNGNIISTLDNYGDDSICNVILSHVPQILYDKKLSETPIRSQYNISIMAIKRKNKPINLTKDTIIQPGDSLIVFGSKKNINELFGKFNLDQEKEEKALIHNIKNRVFIVENYGEASMCEVTVNVLPEVFKEHTIFNSNIKGDFGINVMLVMRNRQSILIDKSTKIQIGDKLVCFGDYQNIKLLFDISNK